MRLPVNPGSLLLAVAMVVLYLPALDGQILDWDDTVWIQDPVLQMPFLQALQTAFGTLHDRAWYPLLRMSWWLQHAITGEATRPMHAVNIGLFALSIPLVATLLERSGLSARAAFVATALWAAHPTRVESVAWLTSRKDVLSLVLVLGSAHALLSRRAWLATGLFAAACMSKAAVFPLAGVLLLLLWARRLPLADASGVLAIGAATAVFGGLAYAGGPGYPYEDALDNLQLCLGLEGMWWRRLARVQGLAAIQPLPRELWPNLVGGLLCLGGAGVLASRAGRYGALLFGLWLLPLLPVHGLVPMPFWGADRHLLLPSLAAMIAVAWAFERGARWWWPLFALPMLLGGSLHRIHDWADSSTLWRAEATRKGDHWVRELKLGTTLGRDGDFAGAAEAFRRATALKPGDDELVARRILAESAEDGWSREDAALVRALQPPPETAEQWQQLATVLEQLGHTSRCVASAQAVHHGAAGLQTCE